MAVLIVDRDPHCRDAVRLFLRQMGVTIILEAKSGEDALKLLDREGSRVRFILSERDLPGLDGFGFLERVQAQLELHAAPFLMLASDEAPAAAPQTGRLSTRLDGVLLKPFTQPALERAMSTAYAQRKSWQSTLVYLGEEPAMVERLQNRARGHWRTLRVARSQSEITALVEAEGSSLGVFLIEPELLARFDESWLPQYRKTLYGMHTLLVGLSVNPTVIYPLRSHCHLFIDRDDFLKQPDAFLERITVRALTSWERECLGQKFKVAFREGDLRAAEKWVEALLRLDPTHNEVLCFAADLYLKTQRREQAVLYYRLALESNPCFPHPYIKLLEAVSEEAERARLVELATQYCPDHPVIIKKAAQVLSECGRTHEAQQLLAGRAARKPLGSPV